MLERITIGNLALISDAELNFSDKLNILSGETGAGKSIIVDALMLLMGGKYDKTMLSYGAESGFVEGVFSFASEERTAFLADYGIEPDTELIVRRKFDADGKNDIRVNGKSLTAKMLKTVMSHFVDICGQNEYQVLANPKEHAAILDAYLADELARPLASAAEAYAEYTEIKKKLAVLGNTEQRLQRIDMLSYQIAEIERANVRDGEEEELLEFRNKALHGEKIKYALAGAEQALGGENGGVDKIYEALHSLGQIAEYGAAYREINERLSSLSIDLDDIAETVSSLLSEVDFSESELDAAEARLQQLRSLKKKYGDLSELSAKLEKLTAELQLLQNSDEEYEFLREKEASVLDRLFVFGSDLSNIRRNGAKRLEADVKKELDSLGMKNAAFEVGFSELPPRESIASVITPKGFDTVEFLLSPNLGQPLLPLVKIISGGEMSRFMLALKVIASKYGGIETMIFDEIDTGISGKIGQEVAKKLADISRGSQVLCVTHLAQIAAMADTQYYIEKNSDGMTTRTSVRRLDREGMIGEIARLSGSLDISSTSRRSAEEIKIWSDEYKKAQ